MVGPHEHRVRNAAKATRRCRPPDSQVPYRRKPTSVASTEWRLLLSRPVSSSGLITSRCHRFALRLLMPTGLWLLFEVGAKPPHDGMRRMGRYNLRDGLAVHIKTHEIRHLIAPSSMLGVEPTSIHSSPQKGMRAQHPRLSRSRRDTPSFETHNGRSTFAAGTALHAPYLPLPDRSPNGAVIPDLLGLECLALTAVIRHDRRRGSRTAGKSKAGSRGVRSAPARPVQNVIRLSRPQATPQGGRLQLAENTTIGARETAKVAEAAASRSFRDGCREITHEPVSRRWYKKRGSAMPGDGMALAGPIRSKGAAVGGTTLRRVGSATLQARVGIPDDAARLPQFAPGALPAPKPLLVSLTPPVCMRIGHGRGKLFGSLSRRCQTYFVRDRTDLRQTIAKPAASFRW